MQLLLNFIIKFFMLFTITNNRTYYPNKPLERAKILRQLLSAWPYVCSFFHYMYCLMVALVIFSAISKMVTLVFIVLKPLLEEL